jgi:hypothetical protein
MINSHTFTLQIWNQSILISVFLSCFCRPFVAISIILSRYDHTYTGGYDPTINLIHDQMMIRIFKNLFPCFL